MCRRGAAFGLAGVVKGLGLMAMKNCGIMDALKAAVEDKKDAASREVRCRVYYDVKSVECIR